MNSPKIRFVSQFSACPFSCFFLLRLSNCSGLVVFRDLHSLQRAANRYRERSRVLKKQSDSLSVVARFFARLMATLRWTARRIAFEGALAYSDALTALMMMYARVFHREQWEMLTEQIRTQDQAMML